MGLARFFEVIDMFGDSVCWVSRILPVDVCQLTGMDSGVIDSIADTWKLIPLTGWGGRFKRVDRLKIREVEVRLHQIEILVSLPASTTFSYNVTPTNITHFVTISTA